VRFIIAAGAGLAVALLLFLLMNTLISGEQSFDRDALGGNLVDFIRVRPDEILEVKERVRPDEPPPPEDPPPPPPMNVAEHPKPSPVPLDIELPNIVVPAAAAGGPSLGRWSPGDAAAEGDVIPIVRINPVLPRAALLDRIEGWVKVEITILPDGTVGNVEILDSEPRGLFDRNTRTAVLKWIFKPAVVDGQAVARQAIQIIDFSFPD
jgi:protein TonB